MFAALRYLLSGGMLVAAVLAGLMSASAATDPENAPGSVPLGLFSLFFLYLAWRAWTAGAVITADEVTFRGAWRSTAVQRSAFVDVRVGPLVASGGRRFLNGQSLMTHEVVVQVQDAAAPLRLGPVGFAFASEEGAAQFVSRLRPGIQSPPTSK
ncbi:hypothetical protein [Terrabacter sp. 2YAF2]|uniref:hypothetical protein n=1 Tax=Terrabacter sp. 2YAF2 TaxID=3233026 RepID=UPI003F9A3B1F